MTWNSGARRSELPPNWRTEIVPRIKARDKHRCVKCSSTERLEVDHIDDPHDHRDANLQTLCKKCHSKKTGREGFDARHGLRMKRGQLPHMYEEHPGMRRRNAGPDRQ